MSFVHTNPTVLYFTETLCISQPSIAVSALFLVTIHKSVTTTAIFPGTIRITHHKNREDRSGTSYTPCGQASAPATNFLYTACVKSSRRLPPTRVPGAAAVSGNFHSPLCTSAGGFFVHKELGHKESPTAETAGVLLFAPKHGFG